MLNPRAFPVLRKNARNRVTKNTENRLFRLVFLPNPHYNKVPARLFCENRREFFRVLLFFLPGIRRDFP